MRTVPFGATGLIGHADPLAPPTLTLRSWSFTLLGVVRRSWRPVLLVTGVSVAVPLAAVELAQGLTEAAGYRTVTSLPDLIAATGDPGALVVGLALPAVLLILTGAIATIGWAGGVWALVGPAATGRPVNITDAYRYGLSRLTSLGPWTLGATVLLLAGLSALVVPGIYLLFALSMFSFTVLFEHGRNPLLRSLTLTHTQPGRALARWGILAAVTVAYEGALSLIFGTLSLALLGHPGFGTDEHGLVSAVLDAIHTAVGAPTWALLVIGLTVTYADLHNSGRAEQRDGVVQG